MEKRPPTEFVAQLPSSFSADAFIHYIDRDTSEQYMVVIADGEIAVMDLEGNSKIVNAPGGLGYLSGTDFAAVTVADYTFIVNRTKVCKMDQTPNADQVVDPDYFRWLSKQTTQANGFGVGSPDLWFSLIAGKEVQYAPNPAPGTYAGEVATMEKLPETAPNGSVYKVTGSSSSMFRSYYVQRNGAVWDETMQPGQVNALDATTLPHCLVREADGTFTFAPFSWAPRRVGDPDTNPQPTFVGRCVSDVYFYQNRLALLVDENTILSCAGDFGNFWRTTVLDSIASDVVDVAVTSAQVSILKDAVIFNDGVLLFSDQNQFSMTNGEDGVTASSVAVRPVTHYRYNQRCKPIVVGTEVYFAGDENGKSVVWEYTRQSDTDATSAAEITAHVPDLLPANLAGLIGLPKGLLSLTGGPDVYCYQLYWNGDEKIMSAWRPWRFDGDVIGGTMLDSSVYLMIRRAGTMYLERINMGDNAKPTEQLQQTYLDRRAPVTGVYNPVTDRTRFELPYEPNADNLRLIRGKTHPTAPGSLMDPSRYVIMPGGIVEVPGNETGTATCGEVYNKRFVFSRQFPLTPQAVPMTTGRLQLRTFTINYTDTAYFKTEVQPYGSALDPNIESIVPAKLAEFTGKVVGAASLQLNRPIYHTGSYSFQIYGDAAQARIALSNDTHVGSTFVSAEWEGFYTNRTFKQ